MRLDQRQLKLDPRLPRHVLSRKDAELVAEIKSEREKSSEDSGDQGFGVAIDDVLSLTARLATRPAAS
jgi:hypothetical protein